MLNYRFNSICKRIARGFLILAAGLFAAQACTIFVLTDAKNTLFFNNEDYSNPNTRLWFVPGGSNYFGAAYAGFDDGWAQGGLNTEGLAYDWVAGFDESNYKPAPEQVYPRGNSSVRMLETCRTISEAVDFYKKHAETSFESARIMIADRSGASVIIGASKGKLEFVESKECRGFGYGREVVDRAMRKPPKATLGNGIKLLKAARQEGQFATKYANVFDLRSGEIVVYPDITEKDHYALNLAEELRKGGHYYDIPKLAKQLKAAPQPLLPELKRFYLDEFEPVSTPNFEVQSSIKRMIEDIGAGQPKQTDYEAKFWSSLPPPANLKADLENLGPLISVTEVQLREGSAVASAGPETYYCIGDYTKARVLHLFNFDKDKKVTAVKSGGVEMKRAAPPP